MTLSGICLQENGERLLRSLAGFRQRSKLAPRSQPHCAARSVSYLGDEESNRFQATR